MGEDFGFVELDGLGEALEGFGLSEDVIYNGLFMILSQIDPKGEDWENGEKN